MGLNLAVPPDFLGTLQEHNIHMGCSIKLIIDVYYPAERVLRKHSPEYNTTSTSLEG